MLLDGLIGNGVLILPAVVESPGVDAEAWPSVSSGERCSSPLVRGRTPQQSITVTPAVQSDGEEEKMFTLPQFVPFSAESSHGSQLEAQFTERVAHLRLEKEERECELQLRRELEFRKLEETPLLGCARWSCWKAQFALLAVNSR